MIPARVASESTGLFMGCDEEPCGILNGGDDLSVNAKAWVGLGSQRIARQSHHGRIKKGWL